MKFNNDSKRLRKWSNKEDYECVSARPDYDFLNRNNVRLVKRCTSFWKRCLIYFFRKILMKNNCKLLALDENGEQHFNSKNGLASMPLKYIGLFYNACTDPCDMLSGPCACGAWHQQEEWPDDIQKHVFGNVSAKNTICKRFPKG